MSEDWQASRGIDPTVDCVFKRLLGSEDNKLLTLDFLNAILGLEGEQWLKDLDFMDPTWSSTTSTTNDPWSMSWSVQPTVA